jgi:antitoxin Phd
MANDPARPTTKTALDRSVGKKKRSGFLKRGLRSPARSASVTLRFDASGKRIVVGRVIGQTDTVAVSATEAKNNFGGVLSRLEHHDAVFITRHNRPQAVVVSVQRYAELTREEAPDLDLLSQEFDALVARMRIPEARAGTLAAIRASSEELGRAAVLATREQR